MVELRRYDPSQQQQWDKLVQGSSNGTFLLERPYMDYHADRFVDHSLMAYDAHNRLIAVLPANICDTTLCSHQGLTYGGWCVDPRLCTSLLALEIWEQLVAYCRSTGINQLVYKPIPYIYTSYPAQDDIFALHHLGARCLQAQLSAAIHLPNALPFNTNSHRNLQRALRANLRVEHSTAWPEYWQLLDQVLTSRHGVHPVHSLREISLLASRFPGNIKLYVVRHPQTNRMLAGTVAYITSQVVHTQYIAASDEGTTLGALPLLFSRLIDLYRNTHAFLDFGTCTDSGPWNINPGLLHQKNGFGARAIIYPTYLLNF